MTLLRSARRDKSKLRKDLQLLYAKVSEVLAVAEDAVRARRQPGPRRQDVVVDQPEVAACPYNHFAQRVSTRAGRDTQSSGTHLDDVPWMSTAALRPGPGAGPGGGPVDEVASAVSAISGREVAEMAAMSGRSETADASREGSREREEVRLEIAEIFAENSSRERLASREDGNDRDDARDETDERASANSDDKPPGEPMRTCEEREEAERGGGGEK